MLLSYSARRGDKMLVKEERGKKSLHTVILNY